MTVYFDEKSLANWRKYFNKDFDNIFTVPPHALLIKKDYHELCKYISSFVNNIGTPFTDTKQIDAKTVEFDKKVVFVVTSFGFYSAELADISDDDVVFEKVRVKYPHLSYILDSTPFIKVINIPVKGNNLSPINYVENSIKDYINENIELLKIIWQFKSNLKETICFNLRLQTVNDLNYSNYTGGHGKHVTPFLYSSESKSRKMTQIDPNLDFFFTDDMSSESNDFLTKGVSLRILLIDDKLNPPLEKGRTLPCKALFIKSLLELNFQENVQQSENLKAKVCWRTPKISTNQQSVNICYYDDKNLPISQNTDNSVKNYGELKEWIKEKNDNLNIQLVAVDKMDVARGLLSEGDLRFDIILIDYLLGNKDDTASREYGTRFWVDRIGSIDDNHSDYTKYFELERSSNYYDKYRKIKENRGPLKRLWIFPITAFNQTFLDDLRNKGISLIDYYWYLNRGADPINNPYNFIYSLNMFLQLQLKEAIFSGDDIKRFLEKSVIGAKPIEQNLDFIAYMGAEYTVFVEKYCKRPVIFRDMHSGSLFAKYIWENFYSNTKFRHLFRFVHYMQKFYHKCAFGSSLDAPQMLIYLNDLNIFLDENPDLAPDKYSAKLDVFRERIKKLF